MINDILLAIVLFCALIFGYIIIKYYDDNNKTSINISLYAINQYIKSLFYNRNIFGLILSSIIAIISIPGIISHLLVQVLTWVVYGLYCVYRLGDKK